MRCSTVTSRRPESWSAGEPKGRAGPCLSSAIASSWSTPRIRSSPGMSGPVPSSGSLRRGCRFECARGPGGWRSADAFNWASEEDPSSWGGSSSTRHTKQDAFSSTNSARGHSTPGGTSTGSSLWLEEARRSWTWCIGSLPWARFPGASRKGTCTGSSGASSRSAPGA